MKIENKMLEGMIRRLGYLSITTSILLVLITSSPLIWAQDVSGELMRWHKVTLTFDGPNTSETASPNPFLDYSFEVTFTHPGSGKTYVIPGYYAACGNAANNSCTAGNKWRVHFAPDRTGTWNWQASFRSGNNVAINGGGTTAGFMHGQTGSLNISESNKTGRDHRSKDLGRLQYIGEHYLRFSGTTPDAPSGPWFFKFGPDAPENMMAYDDFDDTPNRGGRRKAWSLHQSDYSAADASTYTWGGGKGTEMLGMLTYLSDQGVNAFSFLTFSLSGDDENVFPHLLKVSLNVYNGYGDAAQWNNGVHHDRFDVSKMDQWEKIFEYADAKGLYLHFKTQETENDQKMDGGNVGTERKVYYRELVARYGHHLALNWNTGEENTQTEAQEKAMADYLDQIDPYNHNIVMHTYPNQKNRYTPLLGNASDYTGASLQSGIGSVHDDVVTWVENSLNANKKWVVVCDEQGPADHGVGVDDAYPNNQLPSSKNRTDNRDATRDQVLWGTLLGGGAGVEYYYGYQTGCSDLDCQDHRTRATKWADGLIAKTFFDTYLQNDLLTMVSADNLTTDNGDYVFADEGKIYAIYLPDGGSTNLNLSNAGGTLQVKWYDPRNGGNLQDGSVTSVPGGGTVSIGTAPNNPSADWVVLVTGDGSGSPPNSCSGYEEQNGLVIMEAENTTSDYDQWILKTDVVGYKGSGHLEFTGNSTTNGPPRSPLTYTFKINQGGMYQLMIRGRKRITPPDESDKSNDCYVRVAGDYDASPDAGDNHQDDAPKNALTSDTKIFGGNENSWGWAQQLDLGGHNNKRWPKYIFKAGETYTLTMSGRSKQFNVDRIIFYRLDDYSTNNARSAQDALEETTCSPTSPPTCSLPWTDTNFTVSDQTTNYSSGSINISCATDVCISMDLEGIGPMEEADYVNVYYRVDGGAQQTISENVNAFLKKTVSVCGISGNAIEIIVQAATSHFTETYYISNITVTEGSIQAMELSAMLEGPFASDTMATYLSSNLPSTDPYINALTISTLPPHIVDWVLVEVRDGLDSSQVLLQLPCLLRKDGKLVNAQGGTYLNPGTNLPATAYIVVKHLNHLGVMTAAPVDWTQPIDFSDPGTVIMGSNGRKLAGGRALLWGGDANGDGVINAIDLNVEWRPRNGSTFQYGQGGADFNRDGAINAVDQNLIWRANNGKQAQVP